ncbi:hypothetical protein J2Z69_002375 [Paenibacillus shirakamiensis]|uniref:Copper amine oxidase-like N-terminal domain-containing protein n=1 Tax=Paenibacillus shirakamiensis TaxID=1265935 RepID=A0ABS4JI08_9BACL|nr:stalk domain-containing protein [Paenibacillus shirakamiensis]MBP2001332.1 hypothetical protein [Paenibacillus shirakamiensis]
MKFNKTVVFGMLLVLFGSILPNQSYAAASQEKTPIILKMNDYYVAYTYPKAPYVDKNNNRLMLPLRSTSELLGAQVSYDQASQSAWMKQGKNVVKIKLGSKNAVVNGKDVSMDTAPVMEKGSMIIPARVLFNSFSYRAVVSQNIIQLKDERLLRQGRLKYLLDDDRVAISRTLNPSAFQPLYYTLSTNVRNKITEVIFNVVAKNISGADVPEGQENLSTLIYFEQGSTLDIPYSSVDIKDRKRPSVKKDAQITKDIRSKGGIQIQPNLLQYILVSGRTISP